MRCDHEAKSSQSTIFEALNTAKFGPCAAVFFFASPLFIPRQFSGHLPMTHSTLVSFRTSATAINESLFHSGVLPFEICCNNDGWDCCCCDRCRENKKRDDTSRHFKHTCMFAASKFNLILLHCVFVACQLNNVRAREQRLSSDLVWL